VSIAKLAEREGEENAEAVDDGNDSSPADDNDSNGGGTGPGTPPESVQ
jgi:hypothetical protein